MRAKAILYLGGSYPQIDGIKSARNAGLYVVLTDKNRCPVGREYAHEFHQIDATNRPALMQLALDLGKTYELIGAYGVADYAYPAISSIYLNLLGDASSNQLYNLLVDKHQTRLALSSDGRIAIPRGMICDSDANLSIDAIVEYFSSHNAANKIVAKPLSSYNSIGVTTLDLANRKKIGELIVQVKQYDSRFLLEEMIYGDHYNIDIMVLDGKATICSVTSRQFVDQKYHQALSGQLQLSLSSELSNIFNDLSQRICNVLAINRGVYTIDVVNEKKPYVLEISPHFHALKLNRLSGRKPDIESWFSSLAGKQSEVKCNNTVNDCCYGSGYYYLYCKRNGLIQSIDKTYLEKISEDYLLNKVVGDVVENSGTNYQLLGIVWVKGNNDADVKQKLVALGSHSVFKTI